MNYVRDRTLYQKDVPGLPLTKLIVPQKYKDTTKKRGTEHQNHNLLMFRIRIQDRIRREEIKLHYS